MATTMRRSRQDVELLAAVELLMDEGHEPAAIHRELERMKAADELRAVVPSLRTIERLVKTIRSQDKSAPWSLMSDDTGDSRLILDALAAIVRTTEGRVVSITRAEATALMKVNRSAPELDLMSQWRLARRYVARVASGIATADLDLLMAFAPWRTSWNDWHAAAYRGWVVALDASTVAGVMLGDRSGSAVLDDEDLSARDKHMWLWAWLRMRQRQTEPEVPVSNAVSSSARTATGRHHSPRKEKAAHQDVANDDESSRTAL